MPGDYNLELMQQLEDRGTPAWVGNCNELNASYATDAYPRINGIGALIVTHGVGALSAINGIAGAYSEHVPVVCISGSIPLRAIQRGDLLHAAIALFEEVGSCVGHSKRIFAIMPFPRDSASDNGTSTCLDEVPAPQLSVTQASLSGFGAAP